MRFPQIGRGRWDVKAMDLDLDLDLGLGPWGLDLGDWDAGLGLAGTERDAVGLSGDCSFPVSKVGRL